MKVKLANPAHAAGMLDPHTMRSPFLDAAGNVVEIADVPESNFWVRRVLAGELERIDDAPAPTGLEPTTPLTTRPITARR